MSDRPTNVQLCEAFRLLLTEGAAQFMNLQELEKSKPWRGELWKAFLELEERLCPLEVETRRRRKAGTHE